MNRKIYGEIKDISDEVSIILLFYESARNELIERIHQRDNSLLLSIGICGTLLTLSYTYNTKNPIEELLLFIPFIGFATAMITFQHNLTIGALATYCGKEIDDALRKNGYNLTQWDNSSALREYMSTAEILRAITHGIIPFTFPAVSLYLTKQYFIDTILHFNMNINSYVLFIIWIIGLILTFIGLVVAFYSFHLKMKWYKYHSQKIK